MAVCFGRKTARLENSTFQFAFFATLISATFDAKITVSLSVLQIPLSLRNKQTAEN